MAVDIRVGFSTTGAFLSRLIRMATRSQVSHTFLSYRWLGTRWVIQADSRGVHIDHWRRWNKKNVVVEQFGVTDHRGAETALIKAAERLHADYDYLGLLGAAWVVLGRVFGKTWGNPLQDRASYFCSEFVLHWLQWAGVDGLDHLCPQTSTPEDILTACNASPDLMRL